MDPFLKSEISQYNRLQFDGISHVKVGNFSLSTYLLRNFILNFLIKISAFYKMASFRSQKKIICCETSFTSKRGQIPENQHIFLHLLTFDKLLSWSNSY